MKTIKYLIGIIVLIIILSVVFLFSVTFSSIAPSVSIHSFPNGIHNNIEISNTGGGDYAPLFIDADMNNRTYFEVYENQKIIIRIEKRDTLLNGGHFHPFIYDKFGNKVPYTARSFQTMDRNKDGSWHISKNYHNYSDIEKQNLDLSVSLALGGLIVEGMAKTTDGFGIWLEKFPTFTPPPHLSPFGQHYPWQIDIKTNDLQERINNDLIIHYHKIYLNSED